MTAGKQPSPRRTLGVAGQTASIFGARVFAASCTAVLTIVLARVLGPSGFGRYTLALTVAMVVGYCAELGIGPATGRFVAERLAAGGSIARVAREGLRVKLTLAAAVVGTPVALAGPIASLFGDPGLATLIRVAAAGVLFADVFVWTGAMFESLRDARGQVWMIAAKALCELAAALVLVLGGAGALGAVAGNAIGFAAGAAVGLVLVRPSMAMTPEAVGVGARALMGYGANIWVASIAWLAFERVDQLMLGAFRSTSAVALYEAPWRLVGVLILGTVTLAAVVGPRS